ncbi:MAG: hypothetical protein ACRYGB_10145 [Janthinobacterium lividum]
MNNSIKTKHKFWKILIGALLYSLLTHWKDAKQGFLDGMSESQKTFIQKSGK